MALARTTRATLVAIALAVLAFGIAMLAHSREQNDTLIVQVPLDESDPKRERVGDLVYRGGIDIPRMGQNIGGLSALRWDAESGRLLALTDDARWVWMTPTEEDERLVGLGKVLSGPLLGMDGEPLTGKAEGDSESLTRSAAGGWLIGFEREHRVWRYPTLTGKPEPTSFDPRLILGEMEDNSGLEGLAGNEGVLFLCAERKAAPDAPNCRAASLAGAIDKSGIPAVPPVAVSSLGGVPTDIDLLVRADGAYDGFGLYVLFRSWSREDGNGAAIIRIGADMERDELATVRPPLTVDNFEGLAVREEGEGDAKRTFLYIVSDDNFSSNQRTLLMKFEVSPEGD